MPPYNQSMNPMRNEAEALKFTRFSATGALAALWTLGCAGGGDGLPIDPTTLGGTQQAGDGPLSFIHDGGFGDTKDAYLAALAEADCLHLIEPESQSEHLRCPTGRWRVKWKKQGEQVLVTLTPAEPPSLPEHAPREALGMPWSAEALNEPLRCSSIYTTFTSDGSVTGGDPEVAYATWKGTWTVENDTLTTAGKVEPTGVPIHGPGTPRPSKPTAQALASFPYTPIAPCEGPLIARPTDPKLAARHTQILCSDRAQTCTGSSGLLSWVWVQGASEASREAVAKATRSAWTSSPASVVASTNDTPSTGLTVVWHDDDADPTNPNKNMSTALRVAGALDAHWNGVDLRVEHTTTPQRAPVVVRVGSDIAL